MELATYIGSKVRVRENPQTGPMFDDVDALADIMAPQPGAGTDVAGRSNSASQRRLIHLSLSWADAVSHDCAAHTQRFSCGRSCERWLKARRSRRRWLGGKRWSAVGLPLMPSAATRRVCFELRWRGRVRKALDPNRPIEKRTSSKPHRDFMKYTPSVGLNRFVRSPVQSLHDP